MTTADPNATATTGTTETANTATPAAAPVSAAPDAAAIEAEENAVLDAIEAKAPAAKATAKTTEPAAKATGTDGSEGAEDEGDLTDGLKIPGIKGDAAAPKPHAARLELAAGRIALEQQGFDDADIDAMKPERVAAFGKKALEARGQANAAATADDAETQTTAAPAPVAEFDAALKNTLLDDSEQATLRTAAQKAVAVQVAAKTKELAAAQAKAEQATSAMLRMRFNTALRPLLSEMPTLKDKATLTLVCDAMDALDPEGKVGTGIDDAAFSKLLRQATYVVLGEKTAAATRAGLMTQSRKQAAAAPERPIGNANPASKTAQGISEDDLVLDALEASGGSKTEFQKRLAQLPTT